MIDPQNALTEDTENKKVFSVLGIIVSLLIAVLLGYKLYLLQASVITPTKKEIEINTENNTITPNQGDNQKITINSIHSFADANSEARINFINAETNTLDMKLSIFLGVDDTGELLYESEIISPGESVMYAKYNRDLGRGFHKVTGLIQFYKDGVPSNDKSIFDIEAFIKN